MKSERKKIVRGPTAPCPECGHNAVRKVEDPMGPHVTRVRLTCFGCGKKRMVYDWAQGSQFMVERDDIEETEVNA